MKKATKIIVVIVAVLASFCVGVLVTLPKQLVNHDMEKVYPILDGYRKYARYETTLRGTPPQMGYGVMCEDGSLPSYLMYSGFGNSIYAHFLSSIGGSFDGYFDSAYVLKCSADYYILEKGNPNKYYGPFEYDKEYAY